MHAKLSRRSMLGGALAAGAGLLRWLSPMHAAFGGALAIPKPARAAQMPGTAFYSYDAGAARLESLASYDRDGELVERITYDRDGNVIARVRYDGRANSGDQ